MLNAAQRQEILFKEANEKLASSFYRHSDDIGQNTQNLAKQPLVKPSLTLTYLHSVREVVNAHNKILALILRKKSYYSYEVYRKDNPSKVIETFKCIKKAYNLSNELNKTNMLVVTKPME